ncbi:MAG: type II toxin-antitoxin system RelE family toxin [Deferrisomatales bacterium]
MPGAFTVVLKPRALKDLAALPRGDAERILRKTQDLESGLSSDVKHLTNHTPEYRLRVGSYRVLFESEGDRLVVYRVLHRRDAYR